MSHKNRSKDATFNLKSCKNRSIQTKQQSISRGSPKISRTNAMLSITNKNQIKTNKTDAKNKKQKHTTDNYMNIKTDNKSTGTHKTYNKSIIKQVDKLDNCFIKLVRKLQSLDVEQQGNMITMSSSTNASSLKKSQCIKQHKYDVLNNTTQMLYHKLQNQNKIFNINSQDMQNKRYQIQQHEQQHDNNNGDKMAQLHQYKYGYSNIFDSALSSPHLLKNLTICEQQKMIEMSMRNRFIEQVKIYKNTQSNNWRSINQQLTKYLLNKQQHMLNHNNIDNQQKYNINTSMNININQKKSKINIITKSYQQKNMKQCYNAYKQLSQQQIIKQRLYKQAQQNYKWVQIMDKMSNLNYQKMMMGQSMSNKYRNKQKEEQHKCSQNVNHIINTYTNNDDSPLSKICQKNYQWQSYQYQYKKQPHFVLQQQKQTKIQRQKKQKMTKQQQSTHHNQQQKQQTPNSSVMQDYDINIPSLSVSDDNQSQFKINSQQMLEQTIQIQENVDVILNWLIDQFVIELAQKLDSNLIKFTKSFDIQKMQHQMFIRAISNANDGNTNIHSANNNNEQYEQFIHTINQIYEDCQLVNQLYSANLNPNKCIQSCKNAQIVPIIKQAVNEIIHYNKHRTNVKMAATELIQSITNRELQIKQLYTFTQEEDQQLIKLEFLYELEDYIYEGIIMEEACSLWMGIILKNNKNKI